MATIKGTNYSDSLYGGAEADSPETDTIARLREAKRRARGG